MAKPAAKKVGRAAVLRYDLKKSVLLLPAVILLFGFFLVPIFLTVYYSFTNMALT